MSIKTLLMVSIFALYSFCVWAKKVPDNLLSANVGIVYFEFYPDPDAEKKMAEAVKLFGKSGFNIVATHNITTKYNFEIATFDMKEKKVEYVLHIFNKSNIHTINIVRLKDIKQIYSDNHIMRDSANSISGIHKKTQRKLDKINRKNPLEDTPNVLSHLVDTLMFHEYDVYRVNYLIDKMNIPDYLEGYDYEGVPEDLMTSKMVFVHFDNMDTPTWSTLNNSLVRGGLSKYKYEYEFIEHYDDYLKRKGEFKYRILFVSHDLTFYKEKKHYRQNGSNNHFGTHYKTTTHRTDKQLFAVILRNEETGEIYKCTEHDWLQKAVKDFVKNVSK